METNDEFERLTEAGRIERAVRILELHANLGQPGSPSETVYRAVALTPAMSRAVLKALDGLLKSVAAIERYEWLRKHSRLALVAPGRIAAITINPSCETTEEEARTIDDVIDSRRKHPA